MDRNAMIQALQGKFSPLALEQMVCMEKARTYNIEMLTTEEVERLYNRFFPKTATTQDVAYVLAEEMELKRLRSIVLADAQFMGLYVPNNWIRFNNFMNNRSVLKKPLNAYKIDEFEPLIKQFKSMRSKFVSSKMQVGDSQWYQYFGIMRVAKK